MENALRARTIDEFMELPIVEEAREQVTEFMVLESNGSILANVFSALLKLADCDIETVYNVIQTAMLFGAIAGKGLGRELNNALASNDREWTDSVSQCILGDDELEGALAKIDPMFAIMADDKYSKNAC